MLLGYSLYSVEPINAVPTQTGICLWLPSDPVPCFLFRSLCEVNHKYCFCYKGLVAIFPIRIVLSLLVYRTLLFYSVCDLFYSRFMGPDLENRKVAPCFDNVKLSYKRMAYGSGEHSGLCYSRMCTSRGFMSQNQMAARLWWFMLSHV